MKCECTNCNGSGQVACDDCRGTGEAELPLRLARFDKKHQHYPELSQLQADVAELEKKTNQLIDAKPHHLESYKRQHASALAEIERQAEKLLK